MCEHREHRTGNCRECQYTHWQITTSIGEPAARRARSGVRVGIEMPQRWEGDDS